MGVGRGCQAAECAAVRETGLTRAKALRAFQVGKARTSHEGPWSWMRRSPVASAQLSRPACHLTKALGFRRDVEVLVEAGVRLADLGVAVLDQQPVPLGALAAGEVEADDDASIREPVSAEHVAHRPQGHKGIEVLGGDLEPGGPPLAERHADLEEVVTRGRELVLGPRPSDLGADSTMASRSSCFSRCASRVRESPGAPARISLKLPQPRYRLRMISGVQRSAKISAPRAMGQYWP